MRLREIVDDEQNKEVNLNDLGINLLYVDTRKVVSSFQKRDLIFKLLIFFLFVLSHNGSVIFYSILFLVFKK
jgi:hypothetical protein